MPKLDIGCGGRGTHWEGFVGIDVWPVPPGREADYIRMDFVKDPLPWEPGSVDEAIGLHVIEHLKRPDGIILIQRAVALLAPGARLTITCPDLHLLCSRYLAGDWTFWKTRHSRGNPNEVLPEVWPGKTLSDRLNWAIHQEGHQWAYDLPGLLELAVDAGVKNATPISAASRYYAPSRYETGIEIVKE